MPTPIQFSSRSPNLGLPLLFSGQAQKEFFLNEGFSLLDALVRYTVVSSTQTPPIDAEDGSAYRVTGSASGDWASRENSIAVMIGGSWRFIDPAEGMSVFDQNAGQMLVFRGQWEAATLPAAPSGGAVVDAESRAAINALLLELAKLGILP